MTDPTASRPQFGRRTFLQILAVMGTGGGLSLFYHAQQNTANHVVRHSRVLMGTEINLIVYGPEQDLCRQAVENTFQRMAALNRVFSRYEQGSELATLNSNGILHHPSPELSAVMQLAQHISDQTNGAFDVSVLPLLTLYKANAPLPTTHQLRQALSLVDYHKIKYQGDTISFAQPGMGLTLDGIAKGFIVDQAVSTLRAAGFNDVYVEAGGDLMVRGDKPKQQPWRIGVREPRPQTQGKMAVIATHHSLAVATSGDYMQAFTGDLKNHHIINPRTGRSPATLASATITAPTAALADGLATAAMVLGPNQALTFIEEYPHCEGLFVDKTLQHYRTSGFQG